MFKLKRAYEPATPEDGFRVLVERLWPRGVRKEDAHLDMWLKEIAPSPQLRQWFQHDPAKWDEFRREYRKELAGHEDALDELRKRARRGVVTMVYGSRDQEHNAAVALMEYLAGPGVGQNRGAAFLRKRRRAPRITAEARETAAGSRVRGPAARAPAGRRRTRRAAR